MIKNFPGILVLVVGNSGSGKDSIISGVVKRFPPNLKKIHLTQRYITRPASETEDNIATTPEVFKEMSLQKKFALEWHIYDLDYGVPIDIDDWLKKGHPVIVNVSRTIVKKARCIYRNILVVFIKVSFEITFQRIKERARESGKLLQERIQRAKDNQTFPDADFIVDNSGDLDDAVNNFLSFLLNLEKKSKSNT